MQAERLSSRATLEAQWNVTGVVKDQATSFLQENAVFLALGRQSGDGFSPTARGVLNKERCKCIGVVFIK